MESEFNLISNKNLKKCSWCGEYKKATPEFFNRSKGSLHSHCKPCKSSRRKLNMTSEQKERKQAYDKIFHKEYDKTRVHSEKAIEAKKEWRKEKKSWLTKEYKATKKNYRKRNKHRVAWRQLLYDTLKRMDTTKEKSTIEELGYSALELKIHIQKQFKSGMNWSNHGDWHIDHIKPVSYFDKDTHPSIVSKLNNLRPLWKEENLSKGDKIYN